MISITIIYRFIQRGWWIVLIAATLAGLITYYVSGNQTPEYRTQSSYIVIPEMEDSEGDFGDILYGLDTLTRRTTTNTYAEIMSSRRMFNIALQNLNIPENTVHFYTHDAVVLPETSIIRISVSGPDQIFVTQLNHEIGANSVEFIESTFEVFQLITLDEAKKPNAPISPAPFNDAVLGAIAGAIFGLLIALFRTPEILLGHISESESISSENLEQLGAQPLNGHHNVEGEMTFDENILPKSVKPRMKKVKSNSRKSTLPKQIGE